MQSFAIFLVSWTAFLHNVHGTDNVLCHDGVINQGLCQKPCFNETCDCTMTGQSRVSSCTQTCHWQDKEPCPKITCDGGNACNQQCFSGECNMFCHETRDCSQTCVSNQCGRLICSAKKCYQVCSDCSMECTDDVTLCEQMCLGGMCNMTCNARKCKRMCNADGECNYIGQSSSSRLLRANVLLVTAVTLWYLMKII